ncbi:hypothetical protein GCM10009847_25030 [Leucobacter tardus]|uniref:TetR family transcriptional regulator n=1 Tax=Leucobacter tardus TaxID=501483 RepID=A0A939QF24_9MICO|nr:TetR family transcriptional regulator [Leucobacter tardus]MBO2989988.1 TetR family transcriptional regulator [Leucobacter tardus]
MTTSPRRPRRKPGENRERLLEAGLIEFGLFGYHGASTAAIAARAEVPQPHVYASFATKQELFVACCARALTAPSDREVPSTDMPRRFPAPARVRSRFLLQAFAAARNPQLSDALTPLLRTYLAQSQSDDFAEDLTRGAHDLLP